MKPRLLAVDLDGTLLDPRGKPHAADVRALRALRAAGSVVTILTGRMYSATRPMAELLELDGPVGCIDGSHLVHASSHGTLVHLGIAGPNAVKLRDTLVRAGVSTFLFARDVVIHDEAGDPYLGYMATWSSAFERVLSVLEHSAWHLEDGVTAAISVGTGIQIHRAHTEVATQLAGVAYVTSFPLGRLGELWGMIARAAGGTKGSALEWIAGHHGIALAETVCVGDWINDVPMFARAGRSFAMGQAPPEVKRAATDALPMTCDEGGGIAFVVRDVFGVEGAP